MFSTILNKPHSILRRKIAPIYSKVSLLSSTYLARIHTETIQTRLMPILRNAASSGSPVNVVDLAFGLPMDIMSAYLVGIPSSTEFTMDTTALKAWMETYEASVKGLFWEQEFPNFTQFLSLTGLNLITSKSNLARAKIEKWFLSMISSLETRIEKGLAEPPEGAIYRSLLSQKEPSNPQARLEVASELLDHLLAAQHTTARTITYLISELSVNPDIQASLCAELSTLRSPTTAYALDKLPLLQACILETLRLHPSSAGAEPRVTPHGGTVLAGFYVPGGIRVSAQSYSLHKVETLFPYAERWIPERWMRCQVEQKGMEEAFWAFGSGARRCVGRSFAIMALKALVYGIYGGGWRICY
ncbi:hypothetical protein B7494_g2986 [Chlorociboria aeruginascens]|nr:hypothetical protein B7494_g2986 [Chlorociboria aeruginascens]